MRLIKITRFTLFSAVVALCCFSSLASAGSTNAIVNFGPPLFDSTPVPALSNSVMIVLALLLCVIAFRVLLTQRGAGRFFSIALLAGALTLGGIGVERTVATSEHTVAGDECTVGGSHSFFPRENNFENSCGGPIQIYSYQNCPIVERCPAGTVLAPGQSCILPECGLGTD